MPGVKIQDLSIYHNNRELAPLPSSSDGVSLNVGNSTMALVSEVKEKYHQALKAYTDFKAYAGSTEGKIKFSVMTVGLLAGGVLALRSKSTRIWYKRMIPVGTFLCASSLCYPNTAYQVSKTITLASYSATVSVAQFSKKALQKVGVAYEEYRQMRLKEVAALNENEKETVYEVSSDGIVKIEEDNTDETPRSKSSAEISQHNTVLRLIPEIGAKKHRATTASSFSDTGQSSKEDDDLYTTRA